MSEAVLVCAFNRVEAARAVLEVVARSRPAALFYAVDGPRTEVAGDNEVVHAVRGLVDEVDWPCAVHTRFLGDHAGLAAAMHGAIDWFFSHVERGIIVEDDCLPSLAFFPFCSRVLDRFETDRRVWLACGTNHLTRWRADEVDVFFSEAHIWGWATWADRWAHARLDSLDDLDAVEDAVATYYGPNWRYRRHLIELVRRGVADSWAIPWLSVVARHGGLCALPARNLVANVGHGALGTHTLGRSRFAGLPTAADNTTFTRFDAVRFDRRYQRRWALAISAERVNHRIRGTVKRMLFRLPRWRWVAWVIGRYVQMGDRA